MLVIFLAVMCLFALGAMVMRFVDLLERAARAVEHMAQTVEPPDESEPVSSDFG